VALIATKTWLDVRMAPAPVDAWTAVTDRLTMFSHAFNISVDQVGNALKLYKVTLGHLPSDLLGRAVKTALGRWKWHNAMPTPAELEEPVRDEWAARVRIRARLDMAVAKADEEAKEQDASRKKAVDDAWWQAAAKRQGKTVEELKAQAEGVRNRLASGQSWKPPVKRLEGDQNDGSEVVETSPERRAEILAEIDALAEVEKNAGSTPVQPVDKNASSTAAPDSDPIAPLSSAMPSGAILALAICLLLNGSIAPLIATLIAFDSTSTLTSTLTGRFSTTTQFYKHIAFHNHLPTAVVVGRDDFSRGKMTRKKQPDSAPKPAPAEAQNPSPEKPRIGRPPEHGPEVWADILERHANGETITKICRTSPGYPRPVSVAQRGQADATFANLYARARLMFADAIFDQAMDIADCDDQEPIYATSTNKGGETKRIVDINAMKARALQARLRVDTRLRIVAKINPEKYGDMLRLEHRGGVTFENVDDAALNARIMRQLSDLGIGAWLRARNIDGDLLEEFFALFLTPELPTAPVPAAIEHQPEEAKL
jgi:hypothetical protein